ncbi:MAG: undecaprenyldiphospho-muramoylpentapeptide beta-N-acetylglucosaminyltransferase [Flavobacteriaceae bacterium]|nr:MAG: undecaprenyldiphospho-muramoylpentapeptide beta-N-acetylglucosaminyltransferase [Flavobacteriaceae bacterium]
MKQSVKIIISGGGTGGHIYPAVSIANELKTRYKNASILFVGAKGRMEMEKVPKEGYPIKGLWITGIERKLTLKNLLFPFKLISSVWTAFWIVKQFKPQVVIGTGGFASGPTLFVAAKMGIKTLVQEQNSYPGITNKLLSKITHKICVAYEGLEQFFPKDIINKTGNPVRQDLLDISSKRAEALSFFNLDPSKKTMLVLGGSLGAREVNKLIATQLGFFQKKGVQLIWQVGSLYIDQYEKYNQNSGVQVHAFLNKMDLSYAAADFIVSRAGAGSISELCIVGKPVLFIPSPNVAEDHQTKNAMAVVAHKAALLLPEKEKDQFEKVFGGLLDDEQLQTQLSENIKKLALPNATKLIVDEIEKLIGVNS